MDTRINTADDPSTSDKNLSNVGPVTPEFCRRVCAGRTTRWALPRISSSVSVGRVRRAADVLMAGCACGDARRVSVVRGQVVDVHGSPLIGVRVSVITHPLYGFTLTRPGHAQYVTSVLSV